MQQPHDTCQGSLCRLRCLLGDILVYQLGPALLHALAHVTLGLEGLERLHTLQDTDRSERGPSPDGSHVIHGAWKERSNDAAVMR